MKEKLHDVALKVSLMRFVRFKPATPMFEEFEKQMLPTYKKLLEWTYFAVGCLVARLYYLGGDHEQLDSYYNESIRWLDSQDGNLCYPWQSHIRTLHYQYYANYLHSKKCYNEAKQCLLMSADFIKKQNSTYIDVEICVNICYQLKVIHIDLKDNQTLKPKKINFDIEKDEELCISKENQEILQSSESVDEKYITVIDLTKTPPVKEHKVEKRTVGEEILKEFNDNMDSTRSKKKAVPKRDCVPKFNLNKKLSAPLLILEDETSATLSSSSSTLSSSSSASPHPSSSAYSPKRIRTLRNRRIEISSNETNGPNGNSGSSEKLNTRSVSSSRRRRDI